MRRPRLALLLTSWLVLWLVGTTAAPVRAQVRAPGVGPPPAEGQHDSTSAAPNTSPTITLPVLEKDKGVVYPRQALDEGIAETVKVGLVISIDAKGAVTGAEVEKPAGHGFDEAAVEAALQLVFDPAKRDGVPVASRIRFAYTFSPPAAALSGRVLTLAGDRPIEGAVVRVRDSAGAEQTATTQADGQWRIDGLRAGSYHVTVTAPRREPHEADQTVKPAEEVQVVDRLATLPEVASPDAGEPLEEVEVRGEKPPREVTKVTLSQSELNRIPGTGGDALKSLQSLPGVARPPAFLGLLIVRGSAPEDSQYFIDGTPIPIVYHFGGITSVVPTEAIGKLDFFPGNFSTQYGRAMGGIVNIGIADPKSDRLHALVDVNLIDVRALVQGPVFDTGWRFLVAGRRSWVDAWLGPVLKAAGESVSVAPVYYDYQALLERDLSKHSNLRFGLFGSDDRLALLLSSVSPSNPTFSGSLSTHTGFWRGQVLYRTRIGDDTEARVVGAFGADYLDFSLGSIYFNLTDWPITGRAEISQKIERRFTLNVGLDMIYEPYTVSALLPPLPQVGQPPPGPFSAQLPRQTQSSSSIYEPAAYVEGEATPWKGTRIVPGLRLDYTKDTQAWDFDPRIVVRQDVTMYPRTTVKAGAGLFTQPPQPQETNAVFGTPGLKSNRAAQYSLGVEREVTGHIEASLEGFYKDLDHLVVQGLGNTGSGVIYGAEAFIRYKPDEHFFGWLSYTLSRSLRRDAPGMPLRIFEYDETHIMTTVGSYKLGRGWEFGARLRLISGYMYTPQQYGYYDENIGTYVPLQAYPQYGSRLPFFTSLDLRVDKTWTFRWGSVGAYLDVLNVFNNANVDGVNYNYNSTLNSYIGDLPILPSLGLRVEM
ncbi:MAG: TonB family protein [Polyangiaceae bacterium]|jgi:TonB family protein